MSSDRFWKKVDRGTDSDSCWEWIGARNKRENGYGVGTANGVPFYAHRRAYELAFGEIPRGMIVCHRCDNPPCVNPSHLFVGTYSDNAWDCSRKGRKPNDRIAKSCRKNAVRGDAHWTHTNPSKLKRGSANPVAVLTEKKVKKILSMHRDGESGRRIAKRFGVTAATVSRIVNRKIWLSV